MQYINHNIRLFLLFFFVMVLHSCKDKIHYYVDIPDEGWRLWPDTAAVWMHDKLYLPEDVKLSALPINPPSGGWEILDNTHGIEVCLPSTVEEHFWGVYGMRHYTDKEYYYAGIDTTVKNGCYEGVSWWWKEIEIPRCFSGKEAELFIRAARLRAEVYLNRKLLGYSILGETSIRCDISQAMMPGKKNLLAIRITNPGGTLEWRDYLTIRWGKYEFHRSHAFGGLDRGLSIRAHDPLYIADLYCLNTPYPKKIDVYTELKNKSSDKHVANINVQLYDNECKKLYVKVEKVIEIFPNEDIKFSTGITFPEAEFWSAESPNLYKVVVSFVTAGKEAYRDTQKVTAAFRWFAAEGIGENAILQMNDRRIRLYSAISWVFWGYNGLFPSPELAEKEVRHAKAIGLNCLQFHRNIGKTEVFDAQDRLGLYRYMEPGGGIQAFDTGNPRLSEPTKGKIDISATNGEAYTFAQKYMFAKIMAMIKDHRRHPSLLMYVVQNEITPDLHNPNIYYLLREMRREDPSRIIVLKSGVNTYNQVWLKPYSTEIMHDNGKGNSGWWDQHTVGGPGVWKDNLYSSPHKFTHYSNNKKEIVVWGEMLGAAMPDNHAIMIEQIQQKGNSYDLYDHIRINKAYDKFLQRWGFQKAFPTTADLFASIGNKGYDFWGRVMETVRLAEDNDYLVLSGWESINIENHAGIVDNLRNFKGDPDLIRKRMALLKPVFKPSSLVIKKREQFSYDIFLLNETHKAYGTNMLLIMKSPDGTNSVIASFITPEFKENIFVYPIAQKVLSPVLEKEGEYHFRLVLDNTNVYADEMVLAINPWGDTTKLPMRVGVNSPDARLIKAFDSIPGVTAEKYNPRKDYQAIVVSSPVFLGRQIKNPVFIDYLNTPDDTLFQTAAACGYPLPYNYLSYHFKDLINPTTKVTLRFASNDMPDKMDVTINGRKVLNGVNIGKEAAGQPIIIEKTFTVATPKGILDIEFSRDNARIHAMKIESGRQMLAINCGGGKYKDKSGILWSPYIPDLYLHKEILAKVEKGARLLILPVGSDAAALYAKMLGNNKIIIYKGEVLTSDI